MADSTQIRPSWSSDAGPLVLPRRVELLEHPEYLPCIPHIKTDPVVPDEIHHLVIIGKSTDLYPAQLTGTGELQGIRYQVQGDLA
jgi:hypothetical protein